MLTLTENAKTAISGITHQAGLPATGGVRIALADQARQVELSLAPQPEAGDAVIEDDGARVFVAGPCCHILATHTLDADETDEGVSFALRDQD
ncbi:Fe-S cluster assembly protein HesB [Georgenia faecalis]|uniref:Fe-S cluster assembly protein HesB n=1 Tax=Georgenia faecalis TaxID=2483799 RepID=A0ABV9DBV9_9MICO|nr:Fe-S cluster assembly protein HesB [Georgenia faecalis]